MTGLIIIGVLAALLGLILSSQATSGVALIAFGCFCGIMARILQASRPSPKSTTDPEQTADQHNQQAT
jgi:hypothetical protein